MEYLYAVLLLHSAKKEINEKALESVIGATGEKADKAKLTMIIESLKNKNIDELIENASQQQIAAPAASTTEAKEKPKEEKAEKEQVKDEDAEEGLSALFG